MSDYINILKDNLSRFSINQEEPVLMELVSYITYLFEINQRTNLTSITNWEEALIKHIVDSLLITTTDYWKYARNILDVGSGAGFPGIPLMLIDRDKNIVLIESNKKKTQFLKSVKEKFRLGNLHILPERAEIIAHQKEYREKFDLVVARALACLPTLLELTIPFCHIGGLFAAYKGPEFQEELNLSCTALMELGAEYRTVQSYFLPKDKGKRSLLFFTKTTTTPVKFPRKPGIPNKRPIL